MVSGETKLWIAILLIVIISILSGYYFVKEACNEILSNSESPPDFVVENTREYTDSFCQEYGYDWGMFDTLQCEGNRIHCYKSRGNTLQTECIPIVASQSSGSMDDDVRYSDMLAACYKGCQFASQPVYGISPVENVSVRVQLYDDCADLCESRYKRWL